MDCNTFRDFFNIPNCLLVNSYLAIFVYMWFDNHIMIKNLAFVVGEFPCFLNTYSNNHILALLRRGFNVEIFSLKGGNWENMPEELKQVKIRYLTMPDNKFWRICVAIPKIIKLLF